MSLNGFVNKTINEVIQECRNTLAYGAGLEAVLGELRNRGLSKIHAMKVLVDLGVDIALAKLMVHESPCWADVRERDEKFHEELERRLVASPDSVEIKKSKQTRNR